MLIASGSLLYHGIEDDLIFARLDIGCNVKLSEGTVTEVAAIGLVYFRTVNCNFKYIGSLGNKIDLLGNGINRESIYLL